MKIEKNMSNMSNTPNTFLTFLEKGLEYNLEEKVVNIKYMRWEGIMNHSFNIELAEEYGIEEAILMENIAFWLRKNMTNNKNYIAGNYWVHNSYKSFNELFPYINPKKIQRVLVKLEKLNVIKSGSFNKRAYDRTKWYTIVSIRIKKLYNLITSNDFISKDNMSNGCSQNVQCTGTNCPMDIPKMSNGRGQSVQPIPDIKPVIKTNIKTTTVQESKLDRPLDEQKIKDIGGYLDSRKKVRDNYVNSLSKEKQRNIMEEAYAKAKKEYRCIWEVMGRTKVKYEILKNIN